MYPTMLILLGVVAALSSATALDLTPKTVTRELEGGFRIPVLRFSHDGKAVEYKPPGNWKVTGSEASLVLTPKDIPQCSAQISVVKRDPRAGSVANGDENLEKWIRSRFIPEGATEVQRAAVFESPFMLGELPSRDYHFRFRRSTSSFVKSISVVDLNDQERVVVEVSAAPSDFEPAWDEIVRSLFTWEWLDS